MENTLIATRRANVIKPVTSRLIRLTDKIVNSYLVGEPRSGTWVIVDAGMSSKHARKIITAAAERFGAKTGPTAILLTHGHFDHIGALGPLLQCWDVPVYAHPLEFPYLDGRADYPPPDPSVGGGLMARMSPLFQHRGIDVHNRLRALPEDGSVPGLAGWRWIHTPGHTPGHVSFFRDLDRVLIAGDAFVTVKNESLWAVLRQKQEVSRPPAYFTTDWTQARESVSKLADLNPEIAATGHGIPMTGETLRRQLADLRLHFGLVIPPHGRYVAQPAIADQTGVRFVPPAPSSALPKLVGVALAGMVTAIAIRKWQRRAT